jgi:hypothetical protein
MIMKKAYRIKKLQLFIIIFSVLIVILFLSIDSCTLTLFERSLGIICGVVGLAIGIPVSMLHEITLTDEGIFSQYVFKDKVLKIVKFIQWKDIVAIEPNESRSLVGVFSKLPGQAAYKFNDIIRVTKNIVNYKQLIREIIFYAPNAKVDESVRKIVEG